MCQLNWCRPKAIVEKFMPNEYIAACGDSGTVYNFECNAGIQYSGNDNYHYKVWTSSGRVLADWDSGYYGPCGITHQADSNDEFLNGYMDDINTRENENIPVIIWTNNGTDVHCTTNLDMSQWSTAKS